MKRQVIVGVVSVLLIYGCSTCLQGPSTYIRGEMVAEVDDVGAFIATASDKAGLNRVTLRDERDTGYVSSYQPFVLDVPDVLDLGQKSIKVDRVESVVAGDERRSQFAITLVDACSPYVTLRDKCQIVNWYNPYRLPQIDVAPGLLDQVIATPLVTRDDYIIGYEIRLGDQGVSDCYSPAYDAWEDRYNEGTSRRPKGRTTVKRPLSTKEAPQNPGEYLDPPRRVPKKQR